jgi:hypothetical protein
VQRLYERQQAREMVGVPMGNEYPGYFHGGNFGPLKAELGGLAAVEQKMLPGAAEKYRRMMAFKAGYPRARPQKEQVYGFWHR